MEFLATAGRSDRGWRTAIAVVCALLVIFAGAAQVAHTHAVPTASHADCSLCVAAHIALQVPQSPVQAAPARVVTRVELAPIQAGKTAVSTFALFTRPPPSLGIVPA